MSSIKRVFTVDDKPFFTLGGQARNSSGYNADEFEQAFQALKLLRGNTLAIPVYWEQVEPEQGIFDFTSVELILHRARQDGVKLILLWFGSWKNGKMEFVPAWVKRNPDHFKRVVSATGRPIWVLSSHCRANLAADQSAFLAFCQYLCDNDAERSVIAVQIENEPGILGSDRDYSDAAQADFEADVPETFLERMAASESGPVYAIWQSAGARQGGSWPELFGLQAGELMTAWSIARYIDSMAQAGKEILDRPMYTNAWLGEMDWRIAGESYPSGGATSITLDIYKWFAPHLDLIAPDIYIADSGGYREICAAYSRADNPLYVPESMPLGSNAWQMLRAIADYNAIGYHLFAIEHILDEDGQITPATRMLVESFHCVANAIPLLQKHQGSDRIQAVVQEEGMRHQVLNFEGYHGMVWFGDGPISLVSRDWRHPATNLGRLFAPDGDRGRGLIFQVSEHEFYLVGSGFRLVLRPKSPFEQSIDPSLSNPFLRTRLSNYVSVDEGYFDDNDQFVARRRRNGDETDGGVWVAADVGVVRVLLVA